VATAGVEVVDSCEDSAGGGREGSGVEEAAGGGRVGSGVKRQQMAEERAVEKRQQVVEM
jgi:hypothetical protein